MISRRWTRPLLAGALICGCSDPAVGPNASLRPNMAAGGMRRPVVLVNSKAGDHGTANTIQEGIDLVADGGRVQVLPGTYVEALVINKGLTLEAVGGESDPVVVAPTSAPLSAIEVVTTQPVVIRGLTVRGWGLGIRANGVAADLTVEHLSVEGVTTAGIAVTWVAVAQGSPARLVVRDSRVDGGAGRPSSGISTQGDVNALIERNVVRHTSTRCINVAFGAIAVEATTVDVLENDLDECGVAAAIVVTANGPKVGTRAANVVGNTIRNSGAALLRNGIYYEGFSGRIEHNSILNVVQPAANPNQENIAGCCVVVPAGIFVGTFRAAPAANVTVRFNDVAGNAFAGIRVQQALSVDATCNWWGAATGPSGAGAGSGDAAVGPATVSPWAVAPIAERAETGC